METQKIAKILTWAVLAFWLIPWQGKQLFPQFFGQWAVQLPCAAFVAVAAPIALLMGLRLLIGSNFKRVGLGVALVSLAPLLANTWILANSAVLLGRINTNTLRFGPESLPHAQTLINNSTAPDLSQVELQLSVWEQDKEVWQSVLRTVDAVDQSIKEIQWLLNLTIISFALIFPVGLLWLAFGDLTLSSPPSSGDP